MRSLSSRANGCAAASIKAFEFVGVEEIDLPVADRVDDGPVVPHPAAHPDQYGSLAAAVKKRPSFRTRIRPGKFRAVFERHVAFGNPAVCDVTQNAADRVQSDALGEHAA